MLYSTLRVFFFWDEGRKLKGGISWERRVGFKGKVGFWHWNVWNVNSNRTPKAKDSRRERCRLCVKKASRLKPRQKEGPRGREKARARNRFQNKNRNRVSPLFGRHWKQLKLFPRRFCLSIGWVNPFQGAPVVLYFSDYFIKLTRRGSLLLVSIIHLTSWLLLVSTGCNITLRRGTWIGSFAWKSFRWASARDSLRNSVVPDVTLPGGCTALNELHLADPAPNKLTRWTGRRQRLEVLALQGAVRRCYSRQERAQLNSPLLPVGEQIAFFTAVWWLQPPQWKGK